MPVHLKAYTPSEKGKELISILFPQSHKERQQSMADYWKQYPREIDAILDGFHFIILELIDARNTNESDELFVLPDELFQHIFSSMREKLHFFSYRTAREFVGALNGLEPPIFESIEKINGFLDPSSVQQKKAFVSKFNLPDTFEESVLTKVKETCNDAETWFQNVVRTLPSIRGSQKIIEKYRDVNNQLTLMDVKLATETLKESKKNFTENAGLIAKSWLYIHDVNGKYPDEPLVVKVYSRYLAKLLATREARYPVENYVLNLAKLSFDLETPDFEPTDLQLQRGMTNVSLRKIFMNEIRLEINRLECRYRKRRLMVKLKENVPKSAIIKELIEIAHIDPLDIKTHILLSRMFSEYAQTIKNHQKRTSLREQALKYCNLAFSKIDDYLDLQAIENIKERDTQRAGFVKSISAIRIPLLRRK
jgi:hypothetical protein